LKHPANTITALRIIFAVPLLLFYENKPLFIVFYLLIGLTDVLDGYVARKTNTQSSFGARLDTSADLLFFGVVIAVVFLWTGTGLLRYLPLFIAVALIRGINMLIAARKYHRFVILHTVGNKITGLLLFAAPLFLLYQETAFLWPLFIIAFLSSVEVTLIHLTSKELDADRRGFFSSDMYIKR
jgi:phosphatidylglycerophosphate synthase